MKTVIDADSSKGRKIKDLPKVYLLYRCIEYGCYEFPFSGKCDERGVPLVWYYQDYNGAKEVYELKPITETTIYATAIYSYNENQIKKTAKLLNEYTNILAAAEKENSCLSCRECIFYNERPLNELYEGVCTFTYPHHAVDSYAHCSRGVKKPR